MMDRLYCPEAREVERLRHRRRLLAAEDDFVPSTRMGFKQLQDKLATDAAASRERNTELLQLLQGASDSSNRVTAAAADVQLFALRGAYLSLVHQSFPKWYSTAAEHIQQRQQQQQQQQQRQEKQHQAFAGSYCQHQPSSNGMYLANSNLFCRHTASTISKPQPSAPGPCGHTNSGNTTGRNTDSMSHSSQASSYQHASANARHGHGTGPEQNVLKAVSPAALEQLANSMSEQLVLLQQLMRQQQQQQQHAAAGEAVVPHKQDPQQQQEVKQQAARPQKSNSMTDGPMNLVMVPSVMHCEGVSGMVGQHTVALDSMKDSCVAKQSALTVPSALSTSANTGAHSLPLSISSASHQSLTQQQQQAQQQEAQRVVGQANMTPKNQQLCLLPGQAQQQVKEARQLEGPARWQRITEHERQQEATQQQQQQQQQQQVQVQARHQQGIHEEDEDETDPQQQQWQVAPQTTYGQQSESAMLAATLHHQQLSRAHEPQEQQPTPSLPQQAAVSAVLVTMPSDHGEPACCGNTVPTAVPQAQPASRPTQQQQQQQHREEEEQCTLVKPMDSCRPASAPSVEQWPRSTIGQVPTDGQQQSGHGVPATDTTNPSRCSIPCVSSAAANELMSLVEGVLVQQDSGSSNDSDVPSLPSLPLGSDDELSPEVTYGDNNSPVVSEATAQEQSPARTASKPGSAAMAAGGSATAGIHSAAAAAAPAAAKCPKAPPPAPPLLLAALNTQGKSGSSNVAGAAGTHLGSAVAAAVAQPQHTSSHPSPSGAPTLEAALRTDQQPGISSLAVALSNTSTATVTSAAASNDTAFLSASAVISRAQGFNTQQQHQEPLGFQRIPSKGSSQPLGSGLLLSPATRLSLGAVGNEGGGSSGRPSLSSESEVFSPQDVLARRLSLGAGSSSGITAGVENYRSSAPLKVPNAAVPGRRISNSSSHGVVHPGPHSAPAEVPQDQQQQQQQQQQEGGGFSPLSASIHRLGSGSVNIPLLQLGKLINSPQKQQQVSARSSSAAATAAAETSDEQPPLQRRQRQSQQQHVGGGHQQQPLPAQSTGTGVTVGAPRGMQADASPAAALSRPVSGPAASNHGRLVSKVLNTGLTDFAGSDSDDADDDGNAFVSLVGSGVNAPGVGSSTIKPSVTAGSKAGRPVMQHQANVGVEARPRGQRSVDEDEFDF